MSVLLDVDPFAGVVRDMLWDNEKEQVIHRATQDVTAIIEANKRSYNDPDQAWRGEDNDWWRVASIPLIVLEAWAQEYARKRGVVFWNPYSDDEDYTRFLEARLEDPEFRYFKTAPVNMR